MLTGDEAIDDLLKQAAMEGAFLGTEQPECDVLKGMRMAHQFALQFVDQERLEADDVEEVAKHAVLCTAFAFAYGYASGATNTEEAQEDDTE